MHGNGKCMGAYGDADSDGYGVIPWDCVPEKGQLWSWNDDSLGSGNRHICNGHRKCLGSPENTPKSSRLIQWESLDEGGQKFNLNKSETHPEFYVIQNDHGKCLGVMGDNDDIIGVIDCNSSDGYQRWKWHNL